MDPARTSLVGMTAWEELRLTLARLLEDRPGAVTSSPDLGQSDGGPPPAGS